MFISNRDGAIIIFIYNSCTSKKRYYFYSVEAMTRQHKKQIKMNTRELLNRENLTELEVKIMDCFISNLYAEPHFSDVDVRDIAKEIGISTNVIRGSLASLIKKQFVTVEDNGAGYQIIYLCESKFYLHPEWSKADTN